MARIATYAGAIALAAVVAVTLTALTGAGSGGIYLFGVVALLAAVLGAERLSTKRECRTVERAGGAGGHPRATSA